ncbi:MAG: hypothetical protein ORN51_08520 [Akkermansiaceae bacterium]|nr:hypothetical protein [Akkermansiaceae bacterium]
MKKSASSTEKIQYKGSLRHYHRSNTKQKRSWDEWVDGPGASKLKPLNLLKIAFVSLGVIALIAVIGGLIIELR